MRRTWRSGCAFSSNDGVVDGKRLVEFRRPARDPHAADVVGAGLPASDATTFNTYGMGWIVQDYRHEVAWQHGGDTPGMTAAVGMLPREEARRRRPSNMDPRSCPTC